MSIRKQTKHWVTKTGERVRVCDMGDQHLLNAEAMVSRNYRQRCLYSSIEAMSYAFSAMTPDGASDCALSESEALAEEAEAQEMIEEWCPAYPALIAEIERRKLERKV